MNDRSRIRIRLVRRSLGAGVVAALLAGPAALALLETRPTSPERSGAPHDPRMAAQRDQAPSPELGLAPPRQPSDQPAAHDEPRDERSSGLAAARAEVAHLRQAPRAELLELARSGDDAQRLKALNVLWARGERAAVERLAAEAPGDRLLVAKLEALRAAR